MARALARIAAERAVGVERDPEQLAQAVALADEAGEADLVEFRAGDAMALPLAPGEAFDLVHSRFVLEHLADPAGAVREMARAVCPGGRVFLADDDHPHFTLNPECPPWAVAWEAYQRAFERNDTDPRIGRRLTTLLVGAGLTPTRNGHVFYGAVHAEPHFMPLVRNLAEVMRTGRTLVAAARLMDADAYQAGIDALDAWATHPDAAIWYAVNWAEGRSEPRP
jgi:SAM-dependent methyltransferase